eukprot:1117378_1
MIECDVNENRVFFKLGETMTTRIGFDPNAKMVKRVESAQSKQMFKSDDPFQIDKWYDACKDDTFETRLIPLTIEQAKAIKFMCEYFRLFKEHEIQTNESKGFGITVNYDKSALHKAFEAHITGKNSDTPLSYHWGESFNWKALTEQSSQQYVNPLIELEENINEIIEEFKGDDGIFIRLNTRSPKDSAIEGMKTFELLFEELKEWNAINRMTYGKKHDEDVYFDLTNDQISLSFHRAVIKSLCAKSGFEAIQLLCRSYERIFYDLNISMLKQGEENLKLYCTIRKWYDVVDPIWEFRLIVKDYKPTALTQYNDVVVIPNAKKHKHFFQQRILEKFEVIKEKLSRKLRDYTVDFAVVLKNKDMQNSPMNAYMEGTESKEDENEDPIDAVYLIEINHTWPTAGTALFDFRNEEDKKVLTGDKPFEFRLHESKENVDYTTLDSVLPPHAIDFISVIQGQYQENVGLQPEKTCVLL